MARRRQLIRRIGRMKTMESNDAAMEYIDRIAIPAVNTGTIILHCKDGRVMQIEETKKTNTDRLPDAFPDVK